MSEFATAPPGTPELVVERLDRFDWERIVRELSLPKEVKLTALVLATFAGRDGRDVRPGEKRLSRMLRVGTRTVREHLKALRVRYGLIRRTHKGGGPNRAADVYELTVPDELPKGVTMAPPEMPQTRSRTLDTGTPAAEDLLHWEGSPAPPRRPRTAPKPLSASNSGTPLAADSSPGKPDLRQPDAGTPAGSDPISGTPPAAHHGPTTDQPPAGDVDMHRPEVDARGTGNAPTRRGCHTDPPPAYGDRPPRPRPEPARRLGARAPLGPRHGYPGETPIPPAWAGSDRPADAAVNARGRDLVRATLAAVRAAADRGTP